jgi:hypothetical protein
MGIISSPTTSRSAGAATAVRWGGGAANSATRGLPTRMPIAVVLEALEVHRKSDAAVAGDNGSNGCVIVY